jgi:flagellar protein FliO/FliZ
MNPVSCLRLAANLTVFSLFPVETALCATEPDSAFSTPLRLIWGLLIVLGILFIIYGLMKKKMSFLHLSEKGIIKIVEVRHLPPKKSLYLVEVRGQEFLLGAGHDRVELIAAINRDPKGSFSDILDRSETEIPQ